MPALTQTEANDLLNASLGKVAYVAATAPILLYLTTTAPTASAAGTEVAGGSYARQNLTTALPANGTTGTITSTGAVNFTGMPAVTLAGAEAWDSVPKRKYYSTLSKVVGAGDTVSFAVGQISIALS